MTPTQNIKFVPVNKVEAKDYIKKETIHDTEVRSKEKDSLLATKDPLRSSKPSPFMDSILENKEDEPFAHKITLSKMALTNNKIDSHKKA